MGARIFAIVAFLAALVTVILGGDEIWQWIRKPIFDQGVVKGETAGFEKAKLQVTKKFNVQLEAEKEKSFQLGVREGKAKSGNSVALKNELERVRTQLVDAQTHRLSVETELSKARQDHKLTIEQIRREHSREIESQKSRTQAGTQRLRDVQAERQREVTQLKIERDGLLETVETLRRSLNEKLTLKPEPKAEESCQRAGKSFELPRGEFVDNCESSSVVVVTRTYNAGPSPHIEATIDGNDPKALYLGKSLRLKAGCTLSLLKFTKGRVNNATPLLRIAC